MDWKLVGTVLLLAASASAQSKGVVSIAFDDGFQSAYNNGMPIINVAGIKATEFIITDSIGKPGYITLDELRALASQGHEIGAHTKTHPRLSNLSPARQYNEIVGSVKQLQKWGFNPKLFAYPYGDYNSETLDILTGLGMPARTTYVGENDRNSPSLLLKCIPVDSKTTVGQLNQEIDQTESDGAWLVILFHRIDEGNEISFSHEGLQAVINHLIERQTRVVTMSEALSLESAQ